MRTNSIFIDFNEEEHSEFQKIANERHYIEGTTIVKEGANLAKLYIIKNGTVEVNLIEVEKKVVLGRLSDGDIFGEMSFIENLTTSANIVSISDVTLCEIDRESLIILLQKSNAIAAKFYRNLFKILSSRLRFTSSYLASHEYLLFELKKKNEELERMNVKLKELSDIKNEFMGIAAHDIRNPLSTILAYAQFLNSSNNVKIEEKRSYFLEKISSQGNFILNIINNLLDISKIEAGKLALNLTECDFYEVINESYEFNKMLATQKGIFFEIEEPIRPNIRIRIDRERIKEVLNNLYSNAIKYSKPNTKVETQVTMNEKEITVSVRDHGIGIAEEKRTKIFNPFITAHDKSVSGEKSTGLGLAIVKKIIELHSGRVSVQSHPDEGSTFSFSIPFQKQNSL